MRTTLRIATAAIGFVGALVLAVPAFAQPGVTGYPVKQYQPKGRFTTVYANNPTSERVLVTIGSDVAWLIPALDSVVLEPNEEQPIGVEVVRPIDRGEIGHVTLTVHQGDVVGGVGLAIINNQAPPVAGSNSFPIIPAAGIAILMLVVTALALVRRRGRRSRRPRAFGFG